VLDSASSLELVFGVVVPSPGGLVSSDNTPSFGVVAGSAVVLPAGDPVVLDSTPSLELFAGIPVVPSVGGPLASENS